MHATWASSLLLMAAPLATGCLIPREFPAPQISPFSQLVDSDYVNHEQPKALELVDTSVRSEIHNPANVLVLSGGGKNGAYPAGLLKGWTESGKRPRFDVVTGISAGALIAPFAFLGGEYDAALQRGASLQSSDIYSLRLPLAFTWSDSLADSGPLWKHIQTEITQEVLFKIATAHLQGRRLYVGTTNLDTKRLVVWDLGAIAVSNDPHKLDLFRKILFASSSVPGFLPPVPINVEIDSKRYTELHVDGGVSTSLLLKPQLFSMDQSGMTLQTGLPQVPSERTVYVIIAGKLAPGTSPVQRRWFQISEASLSGLLQSQMEGDLFRAYLMTRYTGAKFALAAIPQDFVAEDSNWMTFDSKNMQQLFEEGRKLGSKGGMWFEAPPGIDPREWQTPRRGVRLTTTRRPLLPVP